MPGTKQYLEHLTHLTAGKDPVEIQASTVSAILVLIQSESEERLHIRPASGKWSVVEIIAHLAEDEVVVSWRYRQMLEHTGCALGGFDQEKWAVLRLLWRMELSGRHRTVQVAAGWESTHVTRS
jgi:hypothetical protein